MTEIPDDEVEVAAKAMFRRNGNTGWRKLRESWRDNWRHGDELRMGIYRHYKGPLYQVLGLAHDANADTFGVDGWAGERTVVVYMPLQLDGAHLGPRMAVRTLDDFVMHVTAHGEPTHHDLGVARFAYLGPVLTAEMFPAARPVPEQEQP